MSGRKRRGLSPEDRQLWDQVAATATPLQKPAAATAPPEPVSSRPAPKVPSSTPLPGRPARPQAASRVTLDLAPDPQKSLDRANPHMDRRRFEKLRRGRIDPDARIDLHGMTSERAHAALIAFILNAHADGLRLVLVITGKGRPDDRAMQPHRHGILRHSLPHWLAAPPLTGRILQIAPAHQRHGGAGAFYVYLRRQR
jgi:DNA-nicking Smr family endonuclease